MTRLFVLGLLNNEPMSGYDIQQRLLEWDVSIWADVLVGSIYHALKKLEQEGYISISSVENTGHRQKAIYQITEQGRYYLSKLINEALTTSSIVYPKTLYSGLTFMDVPTTEEIRSSLELQQKTLEHEYLQTEKALLAKKKAMNNEVSPVLQLIFDDMLSTIQRRQDFIKQLLALL